jgi:hypothetical protein
VVLAGSSLEDTNRTSGSADGAIPDSSRVTLDTAVPKYFFRWRNQLALVATGTKTGNLRPFGDVCSC